jgi:predicted ATPase
MLDLAEQAAAGITGPNPRESLDRLKERSDDLLAAMGWFIDAGRTDEALRLANDLYRFWTTKQRFDEGSGVVRSRAGLGRWRRAPAPKSLPQRRLHAVLDGR